MMNREQFGLHHPENIVPACKECNKRDKDKDKKYFSWEQHLKNVCQKNRTLNCFEERKKNLLDHRIDEKYPPLSNEEENAIRVVAEYLYNQIVNQGESSIGLYKKLTEAFVKNPS